MKLQTGRTKRILIADDHTDTVEMTAQFLKAHDYELNTAFNAQQAIALANLRKPDAIILDVNLPDRDGLSVAKELRCNQELKNTILIGLSGHNLPNDFQNAQAAGLDYYLTKPASLEVLLACIDPEKYPTVLATQVLIATNRDLQAASRELLTSCKALSAISHRLVRRSQEFIDEHRRALSS